MNQDLPRSSHDGELASAVLVALAILFAVLTAPSVPNQNLVRDLAPPGGAGLGSLPADFVEAGSQVLFAGSNGYGNELWRSDGTANGGPSWSPISPRAPSRRPRATSARSARSCSSRSTFPVWAANRGARTARRKAFCLGDLMPGTSPSNVVSPVVFGSRVFFAANSPGSGNEVWTTDGSIAGTRLFTEIIPGIGGSDPRELVVAGARIYLSANHTSSGPEAEAPRNGSGLPRTFQVGLAKQLRVTMTVVAYLLLQELSRQLYDTELRTAQVSGPPLVMVKVAMRIAATVHGVRRCTCPLATHVEQLAARRGRARTALRRTRLPISASNSDGESTVKSRARGASPSRTTLGSIAKPLCRRPGHAALPNSPGLERSYGHHHRASATSDGGDCKRQVELHRQALVKELDAD